MTQQINSFFGNNLATFTSADLISHMGLSDRTLFGPPPFTWASKAFIARGKIAHGSSLPSAYESGLTSKDGNGVSYASQMYWDAFAPWVVAIAESDNLCTNAYIRISKIRCYILSASTGIWTRFGAEGRGYPSIAPGKWKFDYTVNYGAPTILYGPTGAPCYLPWDGATQVLLHNPLIAIGAITGSDFGGCLVTCESKLITPYNTAFDATPHYALSIGADLYPNTTTALNTGVLAGRTYVPAIGGSAFKTIPSDGSTKKHYFVTTINGADTSIDGTSSYELANGAASMYMSNAELAANMPRLTPNTRI